MGDASVLSIGEVAARTGTAASALRYYDDLGLVRATRAGGGRRTYDAAALHRLEIVRVLQRAGFSLDEIGQLLDGDEDWRQLAARKAAELEERLAELRTAHAMVDAALACGCEHLESCGEVTHLATAGSSQPGERPRLGRVTR